MAATDANVEFIFDPNDSLDSLATLIFNSHQTRPSPWATTNTAKSDSSYHGPHPPRCRMGPRRVPARRVPRAFYVGDLLHASLCAHRHIHRASPAQETKPRVTINLWPRANTGDSRQPKKNHLPWARDIDLSLRLCGRGSRSGRTASTRCPWALWCVGYSRTFRPYSWQEYRLP